MVVSPPAMLLSQVVVINSSPETLFMNVTGKSFNLTSAEVSCQLLLVRNTHTHTLTHYGKHVHLNLKWIYIYMYMYMY